MTVNTTNNLWSIQKTLEKNFKYQWSIPTSIENGVLSTNGAFLESKENKISPIENAKNIQQEIQDFCNKNHYNLDIKTAGPYVNIHLSQKYLQNNFRLNKISFETLENSSIFLDFFSPNVGKQMHLGHMRSANVGEAMRRILSLINQKTITNNHLGDWGIQFGILIWGVQNLSKLQLDFTNIDWKNQDNSLIMEQLNKIYIETNKLIKESPKIQLETKKITYNLETNLEKLRQTSDPVFELWQNIVNTSIMIYSAGEGYFGLNKWEGKSQKLFSEAIKLKLGGFFGAWSVNNFHKSGEFDLILGESFYQHFLEEVSHWVKAKIAIRENKSIYVDLENFGLGRCYLITSEGYSIYALRDILARFVWAGLFNVRNITTFTDNRQNHSFKQVFKVIDLIIKSGIYDKKNFGFLDKNQTQTAIKNLTLNPPKHCGFGFISLPSGPMSSRTGNIILLEDFIRNVEEKVKVNLEIKAKKSLNSIKDNEQVQKVTLATIKWYDLNRDCNQDYVFDIDSALQTDGNTGVYQLYTLVRLKNILRKNETTAPLEIDCLKYLNKDEIDILIKISILELIIVNISSNYKPHQLSGYLFELTTMINSWYAKYSIAQENNFARKDTLLQFVKNLTNQIEFCLNLLGIETVETL
jgi:arginyl-tRNA synthetase